MAASIVASAAIARHWARPPGVLAGIGWWAVLASVSGGVMFAVDRVTRRLLPLSTLLRMTLAFPDDKPSRFGVALRTGTTHQLEHRLSDVREHGLVGSERHAAEQLLELVAALRLHDRFTRGHGERVRAYAALIGEELGLDPIELSKLQWAGLIHDIGKLAVPDEILNKPGRLTDDEFDVIKTHPAEGMKLIGGLAPWLGEWALAVGEHHERWDGTGYPNRLAGTEISRAGRIVAVADVFDVITAARSYKKPQSAHAAREELARHAGSQFDPDMVRAFLNVSISRLRSVMWPLSWLAHLPYLGSAVTAPAASLIAPALVAVGSAVTGGSIGDASTTSAHDPAPVVSDIGGSVGDGRGSVSEIEDDPALAPVAPSSSTTTTVEDATTTSTNANTTTTTTVAGTPTTTTVSTPAATAPTADGGTATVTTTAPSAGTTTTTPTGPSVTTLPPVTIPSIPSVTTLPPITIPSIPTIPTVTTIPSIPTIPPPALPIPASRTLPSAALPPLELG